MNMIRIFFKCSSFFFIALLLHSNIAAYETCKTGNGKDIKWQNPDATYSINDSGGPPGTITAIQEGMQTWTDVATSDFIFYYDGTTPSTAHGINDRANIVTFGSLPSGTLAENRYWYRTNNGRLLDSDVRFNTYYPWSTDGSPGTFDVQNVATHEHGHSLCLADLYTGSDSEKTMYGNAGYGETKKSTLHQDDINAITYLYLCPNFPARNERTSIEYTFLQDAYDDSVSNDIILVQSTVFTEDLSIDINKSVLLEGGYNCDLITPTANLSVINGTVSLSNGAATMENFIIE